MRDIFLEDLGLWRGLGRIAPVALVKAAQHKIIRGIRAWKFLGSLLRTCKVYSIRTP